ncbi:TonB-dependent receptor [Pseudomaricurvus alkylphenolicus]|uniref:TonB-dependent receptor n=1 Tax=Pseudomaricurvus alkylphenolicus TaxID=1306991 RepID=UPI001421FB69|nr:TonB-dependent receptor [Pseudomaricurvus alkylphenolicus]NIB41514.1 TonB-dependent receptor [Pseudomaricurvus alkylphenolicus]
MRFSPIILSVVAASTISNVPRAQGVQLEEIIVTATKRAESLQDIPVSVTALSADTLQEAGVGNLNDVASQVPSLTVVSNLNPFATAISIRGFGTSQNDPALEASVAFILDGVYMGNSGLGMSDLTDIERIEVLQGPQGTLYGKNSNAGVVSVITKSPSLINTEGYVEATAGNYGLRKYVASITGPVSDSVAYLLSGSWNQQDGWLENGRGDDLNAVEDWNLRGKLLWQVSDELSVKLTASRVERDTNCCGADAKQTRAVTDELLAQGLPVPANDAFDYRNNVDMESAFDLSADAINVTVDYEFGNATLSSITAWNDYSYATSYDGDRSELFVIHVVDDSYTGELMSQEIRLTSDLAGPLQYVAGFYYSQETRTRGGPGDRAIVIGDDVVAVAGAQSGLGPLFALGAQPGDYVSFDAEWETENLAIFGQATYEMSEDWVATLGLRYTRESKQARLYAQPYSSAALFGTGQTLVEQAYSAIDADLERDFSGVTGLASISYFWDTGVMLFASVSTGTKSGGFNGVSADDASPDFDEENTTNYELGIKSQLFDNRLQLNVTAFHTLFDDLQFQAQLPNGVGFFVSNAAQGTSTGLSVDFSALPWPFLMVSGGLQYLDAEYSEGALSEMGASVPQAPKWSGNIAVTTTLPLAGGEVYLRGDYTFMGDHFNNPTYQPATAEQDKELMNIRLGWRDDRWDAALWVNNVTDEVYASLTAAPLAFTGTEAEFLQAPRTYGATLRYRF